MTDTLQRPLDAATMEQVLIGGDLSRLAPAQRVSYYRSVCDSLGLNPLTKPLEYITLNGKLTLYARRDCTDQLRRRDQIGIAIVAREVVEDCYIVTARAITPTGRSDESLGAVPIGALKGEARANAMMKAETKAKRRVTLSICGLGWLDETEIDSIPTAAPVSVDTTTGELTAPEAPLDSPVLPPDVYLVTHVGPPEPTKNPKVSRRSITFSDGETFSVINERLVAVAEQMQETVTPCRRLTEAQGRYTNLVGLERVERPAPPANPPPEPDEGDEEPLPF